MIRRHLRGATPWLLGLLLIPSACGSGVGDLAAKNIGPYGGTVTGLQGSSVVIPSGALTKQTAIAIAKDSTGSPPIPKAYVALGDMFSLTPHGTMFAVPVTVNVPFNAAQTQGLTPVLLKSNAAMDGWDPIAGATQNTTTMQGQLESFSWVVVVKPAR